MIMMVSISFFWGEVLNKDALRKKIHLRGNHSSFMNKTMLWKKNGFTWKWKKSDHGDIAKSLNNSSNVMKLLDVSQNDCQAFVNEIRNTNLKAILKYKCHPSILTN